MGIFGILWWGVSMAWVARILLSINNGAFWGVVYGIMAQSFVKEYDYAESCHLIALLQ